MAHLIKSDQEAIETAARLAQQFAAGAVERDRERRLPREEIDRLSESGLLGIAVPREFGGAGASNLTIAEVFRLLAKGDPNISQIPQNHFCFVKSVELNGTAGQKRFFFDQFLQGKRLGNALSEKGTKHVFDLKTTITRRAGGGYLVNGEKFYCTGALLADWIPTFGIDEQGRLLIAYVPRDAKGVEVVDDWTGMGQRTTASGTTRLHEVRIPEEWVLPHYETYEAPQIFGAFGQIMHVAIDVGIAEAALDDTRDFVRKKTRYWFEAKVDKPADDPFIVRSFGELQIKVHAAAGMLRRAGAILDDTERELNADSAAAASVAVAEAKQIAEWTAL
ncbi:MAG TPA: SfnB family sulfur acquisition oxidoreductase, partial [Candidatus Binataceae bacterium]|nr:SfnB family sulfur acquisition oxidoreductase [Candidatus Binataceae bacterium]